MANIRNMENGAALQVNKALPHLKHESLVLDQKYRGVPKDGHRGRK
ncbi:hypothetical protein L0337_17815 [candidate division KSB1 bacterium]|nr:hypothetical protein [candidate division KSB1 bacterium]